MPKVEMLREARTTVVTTKDDYHVYIGRPFRRYAKEDGTFGNPFKGWDGLSQFRAYFYQKLQLDAEFRRRVHGLRGLRIACFCRSAGDTDPEEKCHGDVIASYLNSDPFPPAPGQVRQSAFSSCDWGNCDNPTAQERFAPDHGWLPCCADCAELPMPVANSIALLGNATASMAGESQVTCSRLA